MPEKVWCNKNRVECGGTRRLGKWGEVLGTENNKHSSENPQRGERTRADRNRGTRKPWGFRRDKLRRSRGKSSWRGGRTIRKQMESKQNTGEKCLGRGVSPMRKRVSGGRTAHSRKKGFKTPQTSVHNVYKSHRTDVSRSVIISMSPAGRRKKPLVRVLKSRRKPVGGGGGLVLGGGGWRPIRN